jgi:hypothetical protein
MNGLINESFGILFCVIKFPADCCQSGRGATARMSDDGVPPQLTYFSPEEVYRFVEYAFTCEYVTEGSSYNDSGNLVPWRLPSAADMDRIRGRLIASGIDGDLFYTLRHDDPDAFRTEILGLSAQKEDDDLWDELCMIFDNEGCMHFGEGGLYFPAYPQ